jgi:hypothetical protein
MVREEGDGYAFLLALFPHPRDVGLIIRSTNSTAYLFIDKERPQNALI